MTRRDLAAAALLGTCALGLGVATWLGSDARDAQLEVTGAPVGWEEASASSAHPVPLAVEQAWQAPSGGAGVVVDARGGVGVTRNDGTFEMLNARDGSPVWSYSRSQRLCAMAVVWDQANLVYEGPKGCGQAIALTAETGTYYATRDALSPKRADVFHSREKLGLIAPKSVQLWRSDLVRTVIVGHQEAPAKPNLQQHTECTFTSALTKASLLATAQECPGQDKKLVRLLKAVPEDSDEPEKIHEFTVPPGSELVAIGQREAAIYAPDTGGGARFQVLREDGSFEEFPAPTVMLERDELGLAQPQTADLDQHTAWFAGGLAMTFDATTLTPTSDIPGVLGAGAALGQRMILPVTGGIAVVDPARGEVERTIPVDRGDYAGPVTLSVAGETLVEHRGNVVVGLRGV